PVQPRSEERLGEALHTPESTISGLLRVLILSFIKLNELGLIAFYDESDNITKTQSKATPNEPSSQGTDSCGGLRCQETIGDTTGQTRVLDWEKIKTIQHNEIDSLKRRAKKLKKKNRSRTHKLKRLYKVGLTARVESSRDEECLDALDGEEMFVVGQNENVVEEIVDDAQVSTAATTVTTKEITLAQALKALKTLKPNVKLNIFQEPSKSTTTTTISLQQSQDNGKGITIEEPMKPKKKDQIRLDEEATKKLQVEFDKEERLTREKAEKEERANIALIET
nr:hypothetical protein [Tanacetum cinerariifolium]